MTKFYGLNGLEITAKSTHSKKFKEQLENACGGDATWSMFRIGKYSVIVVGGPTPLHDQLVVGAEFEGEPPMARSPQFMKPVRKGCHKKVKHALAGQKHPLKKELYAAIAEEVASWK